MSYSDVSRTACGARPGSPTLAPAAWESIPTGTGMQVLEVTFHSCSWTAGSHGTPQHSQLHVKNRKNFSNVHCLPIWCSILSPDGAKVLILYSLRMKQDVLLDFSYADQQHSYRFSPVIACAQDTMQTQFNNRHMWNKCGIQWSVET